jgi:hypothetical protein
LHLAHSSIEHSLLPFYHVAAKPFFHCQNNFKFSLSSFTLVNHSDFNSTILYSPKMKRRDFTWLSIGIAAAFVFPSLHCNPSMPQPDQKTIMPAELSGVLNRKEINEIGEAYRKLNVTESTLDEITEALFSAGESKSYAGNGDSESITTFLSNRIKEDFVNGKTVEINGWILSVTEARQCAYLSLIP